MELRQLRYFVAVAREQNFTRAAEKLNIAQPPLSRQIQQLEEEFGTTLFERNSRPVRLTDSGRLLLEQATQVLDRIEEIDLMMRRLRGIARQRFSIGFVASTLYGKLPDVVRRFRQARPKVEIVMVELTSIEQIVALKEGRIDVGFGRIPLDDPAIDRILLRYEKLSVALPLNHHLASKMGMIHLEDLSGDDLIVYPRTPRPSYADQVLALYREHGIKPPMLHEVRELQTALGLVAAETGVCLVPASVERFRRDNIVYRPLDEPGARSPIIMSTRKADQSADIPVMLRLIKQMYIEDHVEFGK
jgi:DNA-binding transcriptional LysR family regulator